MSKELDKMRKAGYETQKLIVLTPSQVNFLREYLCCLSRQCKSLDCMERELTINFPGHITNEQFSITGSMVDSILKELY